MRAEVVVEMAAVMLAVAGFGAVAVDEVGVELGN